jgi:hypothetical protein
VTLQGTHPLTEETPEQPHTTQILQAAIAGATFEPLITEATLTAAMASTSSNTAVLAQASPAPPANGGGLFGAPPDAFQGDRPKAKSFLASFTHWWKLNHDKAVFSEPYKRVALCISYLKGPYVDDWAELQQKNMDTNMMRGRPRTSELHWTDFEAAFKATYANIAEKISAEKTIRNFCMTGGDIDTYIATFKTLLSQAGYTKTERGALELFKKGLPFGLNLYIINNITPTLDTFQTWATTTRDQQLKWLEGQEYTTKKGLLPK